MPLHLLNGEGGQGAHVAEELCAGAWKGPQEPRKHLIGLWGEGSCSHGDLALHQGTGAGARGALGVTWKRWAGTFQKGGPRGVPPTYLAPWGADAQQDATSSPDHGLELFVVVGETEAEGEGAGDIGGGLGQQQGGVKWLSWEGGDREKECDGDRVDPLDGGQMRPERDRHRD